MSERKIKLQIKDMTKKYDNGDGVEHINLDIYEGEIVTFLGPSGCGKTTILRTIGGFLDVTSGDITVDGQSIIGMPPEKRPTAMVFQSYNLWPHMTIYENLAFGLKLRKVPKAEINADVKKYLDLVSMPGCEKKYPGQLSGGQQQRIAIARSLMLKPSLLLLDEPFSALDAKIRQQMREELKKIQQDLGITVIFVTHDQEEAMSLSHRIVVMNKGKFEQTGTPAEIYDKPATLHVASFIGEMNFLKKDGKTIAVRPEDLTVTEGSGGQFDATVRTVMLLGHYVVMTAQHGDDVIKCYINRELSEKLKGCMVKIPAKAGGAGKLFGSVTSKEVSDALKAQFGFDIAKTKIVMADPIKAFGTYQLKCKLGYEISGTINVVVTEE